MLTREILFYNSGKVEISETGMAFQEFKDLYSSDKKPNKPFFNDCLRALFFIHSMDSPIPITGMSLVERVDLAEKQWLKRSYDDLKKNAKFSKAEKLYLQITTRRDRELLRDAIVDMENFINNHLKNIPSVIKRKGKYKETDPDTGETREIDYDFEEPNFDAKMAAWKQVSQISEMIDKFYSKVQFEDNAKNQNQRKFETDKNVPNGAIDYSHVEA